MGPNEANGSGLGSWRTNGNGLAVKEGAWPKDGPAPSQLYAVVWSHAPSGPRPPSLPILHRYLADMGHAPSGRRGLLKGGGSCSSSPASPH